MMIIYCVQELVADFFSEDNNELRLILMLIVSLLELYIIIIVFEVSRC